MQSLNNLYLKQNTPNTFQQYSYQTAYWCSLLFAFFIPISTALMNLFLLLSLAFIILSGELKNHLIISWKNPVSKVAILLFTLLFLGTFWSTAEGNDAYLTLKKYSELLYLGILLPLFQTESKKKLGIDIFLVSMLTILIPTYLIYFGIMQEFTTFTSDSYDANFTVDEGFKSHIITNILMSFVVFISATRAKLNIGNSRLRLVYILLFILSAYYTIFISTGTTGTLLTYVLVTLFLFQHFKKKYIFYLLLSLLVLIVIMKTPNSENKDGTVNKLLNRLSSLNLNTSHRNTNHRPQLYINSIKMWMSDPILGTGTGSYNAAFQTKRPVIYDITKGSKRNPHNEYLLIAVQLGLTGVLLLLYLFYVQIVASKKINNNEVKYLSQGLVLLIVIGCLGNSLIMDSGEGHFWAFFSAVLFSKTNLISNITFPK